MNFLRSISLTVFLIPLSSDLISQQPEDRGQETTPLVAAESATKFRLPSQHGWELVLSEPLIRQPLAITFDDRKRLWLVEYRQYPEPAGLKPQSRDVHWRIVYDKVPEPPGRGGVPGIDRVSVHEDKDGDGQYETHHVFLDNLNIATAVVPQDDGVWVLNPPYLLFYHDRNRDLQPDGAPDIHLEGFGLEDTHSVVNSLCLGPDGWLYAAQGSTVTGSVRPYGSTESPIKTLGQNIWRYHPIKKCYEVFAEGGGNAFGVAFDDHGDIYSGHNGGDTRGFHYLQGGYYRKGFTKHGSLSNPFSFGYLMPMKHIDIQRFSHTMFVFDQYWRQDGPPALMALDPLHGKLIQSRMDTVGSTYSTTDVEDSVCCDDKWFRPVAIQQGPDGAIYICDWYDFQVAHIYAHIGQLDRDRGRVYRMSPPGKSSKDPPTLELGNIDDALNQLNSPVRWQRSHARNWICRHPERDLFRDVLTSQLTEARDTFALELLWTIHSCGWIPGTIPSERRPQAQLSQQDWLDWFSHPTSDVRKWLVRLSCDDRAADPSVVSRLVEIAKKEQNIHVQCQLASSARRLDAESATRILEALLTQELDGKDPGLVSLIWWAVETHAGSHSLILERVATRSAMKRNRWVGENLFPKLLERWCRDQLPTSMGAVESLLAAIDQSDPQWRNAIAKLAVEAFERAYQNRSLKSVPGSVIAQLSKLGVPSLTLEIRQESSEAIAMGIKALDDPEIKSNQKILLIQLAGEMKLREFLPVLVKLINESEEDRSVLQASLTALAAFEDDSVAELIIDRWASFDEVTRYVAGATLARRKSWVSQWLKACEEKRVQPDTLPLDAQRAMRWIEDESIQSELSKLYRSVAGFSFVEANREAKRFEALIDQYQGDPYRGKSLYRAQCGRCHKLFDDGGNIGPDLTGYHRDQVLALIRNIVAPSLEIREGYETISLVLESGTVLTGFVENETEHELVLKGVDGQSNTVLKEEVILRKKQALSIMPERILESLEPQQVSDLLAYLRSTQPLLDKN